MTFLFALSKQSGHLLLTDNHHFFIIFDTSRAQGLFPDNLRIFRIDMKIFEVPVEKLRRQCDPGILVISHAWL